MTRFTKTLALALAGLGTVSSLATDALACGGRGGGYGGGRSYSSQRVVYVQPRPVCQQPIARQPQFPPMNVQVHGQGAIGGVQPVAGVQKVVGARPVAVQQVGGMQQVGGVQQAGGVQQVGGVQQQGGGLAQTGGSAIGALGGGQPIQGQQIQGQQVQTQQLQTQQVSVGGSAVTQSPAASQAQPQAADPMAPIQQSALDALGSLDAGSDQLTTSAPSQSLPAGEFTATTGTGATIRLNLDDNGGFTWTASSNGKSSTFQGTFSLSGNAFTLLRSNDNQKLEGSIDMNAAGFTLKLSGQNDNGLNFVRG